MWCGVVWCGACVHEACAACTREPEARTPLQPVGVYHPERNERSMKKIVHAVDTLDVPVWMMDPVDAHASDDEASPRPNNA